MRYYHLTGLFVVEVDGREVAEIGPGADAGTRVRLLLPAEAS